jgi:hypothetical protein
VKRGPWTMERRLTVARSSVAIVKSRKLSRLAQALFSVLSSQFSVKMFGIVLLCSGGSSLLPPITQKITQSGGGKGGSHTKQLTIRSVRDCSQNSMVVWYGRTNIRDLRERKDSFFIQE